MTILAALRYGPWNLLSMVLVLILRPSASAPELNEAINGCCELTGVPHCGVDRRLLTSVS